MQHYEIAMQVRDTVMGRLAAHNPVPYEYFVMRVPLSDAMRLSVSTPPFPRLDNDPARPPDRISTLLYIRVDDEWMSMADKYGDPNKGYKEWRGDPTSEEGVQWLLGYIAGLKILM